MFDIDSEARRALNEHNAHFGGWVVALGMLLIKNGICTQDELIAEVTRQKAIMDQELAADRDRHAAGP